MNELQRQHYLSAFGVETYMPRWRLPVAPNSIACEMPLVIFSTQPQETLVVKREPNLFSAPHTKTINSANPELSPVNRVIGDMLDAKNPFNVSAAAISAPVKLAHVNAKPITIEPFSISVWRPLEGVMIVDSRNTQLALPTELLLNNILRSVFSNHALKPPEEVLRWPMIENSFAKRTVNDVRIELQTWLSVQHEIRPIRQLWLMGANAAMYLLPEAFKYVDSLFQAKKLNESTISALILPSLNELLQEPNAKQQFFSAIHRYKFISQ